MTEDVKDVENQDINVPRRRWALPSHLLPSSCQSRRGGERGRREHHGFDLMSEEKNVKGINNSRWWW
jgi:hypothetical protein